MAEYLFAYGKTNINKTNAECSVTTVTLILIKIYDPSLDLFFFTYYYRSYTLYRQKFHTP